MGSRIRAHQLRNGLYVSGTREEQQGKERQGSNSSGTPRAVPYTGGDIKKSGELGKMFDIDHLPELPSRPSSSSQPNSGSMRSNSGSLKKSSGSMPLQPTGLITSGPLTSSGPLPSRPKAPVYGSAVTSLTEEVKVGVRVSRGVVWVVVVVVAMGLMVGAFLMVAVKKGIIMVGVGAVLVPLLLGIAWNCAWGKRGFIGYVKSCPDVNLRGAIDGQYVKLTGVITCGSIPLETSYQRIPRCVYVSTELYEYRGLGGKTAHPKHRFFSWGCRHSEKYVADFYISDFQSGLRALVKAGYGAKVAPFIKPATVVDIGKGNKDLSPNFLRWLADRNLSSDDRIMRLKEGYIKEGSTVSVMGVVRRHDNVLMIVPPQEPISTGCQWFRCLLPIYVEGLVLTCDDNQNVDVVPV